jgi:hypothetical protein
MDHIENHPHAFIKNEKVISVPIFGDHNEDLIEVIRQDLGADLVISCCEFGEAFVDGAWDGSRFWPAKPHASWIWDEDKNAWWPPIPVPDKDKLYAWNESSISWVEV